jgi:hypothetical protein
MIIINIQGYKGDLKHSGAYEHQNENDTQYENSPSSIDGHVNCFQWDGGCLLFFFSQKKVHTKSSQMRQSESGQREYYFPMVDQGTRHTM